jgi:hypothetical protein
MSVVVEWKCHALMLNLAASDRHTFDFQVVFEACVLLEKFGGQFMFSRHNKQKSIPSIPSITTNPINFQLLLIFEPLQKIPFIS